MPSSVSFVLPIRNATRVTALHAPAGQAWRSNSFLLPAGLWIFSIERKIQCGQARMRPYVGSFAGVRCRDMQQTLR